jgi:hypothetical protein
MVFRKRPAIILKQYLEIRERMVLRIENQPARLQLFFSQKLLIYTKLVSLS